MKQYNLLSTKNIVHTGIAGLDKEIVGLYVGEKTILFGKDEKGVRKFMGKLENGCMVSTKLASQTNRAIYVYDCGEREELPHPQIDIVENIFQIVERDERHFISVCKNRMNGVFDFECEIN